MTYPRIPGRFAARLGATPKLLPLAQLQSVENMFYCKSKANVATQGMASQVVGPKCPHRRRHVLAHASAQARSRVLGSSTLKVRKCKGSLKAKQCLGAEEHV